MDFISDQRADGRRFRTLIDDFTREALAIDVNTSIPGSRVVRSLERVIAELGTPRSIVIDNGPEFTGRVLDAWAYERGITLDFVRPGKPSDNTFVESFNDKFRDECLNTHWFINMNRARRDLEEWRRDYNNHRPHGSLGDMTPREFARGLAAWEAALSDGDLSKKG